MPSLPTGLNISSNEGEFEILCLKLLRLRWKRPQLQQHGKRGERQHGVDLLDASGETPLVPAQCKRHEPRVSQAAAMSITGHTTMATFLRYQIRLCAMTTCGTCPSVWRLAGSSNEGCPKL
jgi:hypothetical protein